MYQIIVKFMRINRKNDHTYLSQKPYMLFKFHKSSILVNVQYSRVTFSWISSQNNL